MKHTNKQLIEILDNIIVNKTDFDIDELTGASVSVSITHNHTQLNYYLILFFGYKNRNSVQKKIPINEDLHSVLSKAIIIKIKDMQKDASEDDINDILTIVSNTNRTIGSNTPNYNNNLNNSNKITKAYEKENDFTLPTTTKYSKVSEEYSEALKTFLCAYIEKQNLVLESNGAKHRLLDYDSFILGIEAKDYKYANFVKGYRTWNRSHIERVSNARR